MRCSISAFTRVFDTLWRCTAESGIVPNSAFVTIPGLQRTTPCCAAPGKRSQKMSAYPRYVGADQPTSSLSRDLRSGIGAGAGLLTAAVPRQRATTLAIT
jgi:hypothetical protein